MPSIDLSSIQYSSKKNPSIEPKKLPSIQPTFESALINSTTDSPKVTPKHNLDDELQRNRLLLVIQFYLLEFPEKLSTLKPNRPDMMTLEQLTSLRDQMDAVLSTQSNLKQTQLMVRSGIQMLEFGITYATPIQCQGLTTLLMQDPDAIEDIKHVALKYLSLTPVQPELRLAYRLANATLLLHNVNSSKKPAPTQSNKNIPPTPPEGISQQEPTNNLDEINREFANL